MQINRTSYVPPPLAAAAMNTPATDGTTALKTPAESVPALKQPTDAASMMEYLKETYKNINFDFISLKGKDQIANYAAGKRGLNNVAIAPELLEKMCSDEKLRNRVESILQNMNTYQSNAQTNALLGRQNLVGMGLVFDEDGKVSQWAATEKKDVHSYQPKDWRENSTGFYNTKVKKKKSPTTYKYSHSARMQQLEKADTVSSVRGLIAVQQGEIQKAKLHMEPEEAAKVVGKIRASIRKGQIKIARLHKEEDLEMLRRIAEKKLKAKIEEQLREELRRKRHSRKGEERCQTADLDDVMDTPAMTDERYKQLLQQYAGTSPFDTGALPGGDSFTVSTGGASVPTTVSVSTVATIDISI